jgi:hypothetical protein
MRAIGGDNRIEKAPVAAGLTFRIPHLIAMSAAVAVAVLAVLVTIVALPPRPMLTPAPNDEQVTSVPVEKPVSPPRVSARSPATASASVSAPRERPVPISRPELPPARPAAKDRPRLPEKLVLKHLSYASEDDLRKQLEDAPEVSLYSSLGLDDAIHMTTGGKDWRKVVESRTDLAGLSARLRGDCTLNASAADSLQASAIELRAHLGSARTVGTADARESLLQRLRADAGDSRWSKPEAIPALMQILMAENESVREVLVRQLSDIAGPAASVALAQRAIFDLHPRLRKQALEALKKRSAQEYRKVLVDGFRYPWPAVAGHAAEAVVALKLEESVPALRALLSQPEPTTSFEKPGKGMYVREVVKINHLRNCLVCHDASNNSSDRVRGEVPATDNRIFGYYSGSPGKPQGIFVRADVTYVRQDFSVPLTVKKPGGSSATERFDFVVRERPINPDNLTETLAARRPTAVDLSSPHKQALLFALRELTGDGAPRETR